MKKKHSKYIDFYLDKELKTHSPVGKLVINYVDSFNNTNRVNQFLYYRKLFYDHISEVIEEVNKYPEGILLPERLGKLIVFKYKPRNPGIDFKHTMLYNKDKPKGERKYIYHNNIETDNYMFKIMYYKKGRDFGEGSPHYAIYMNDYFYTFKPASKFTKSVSNNAKLNFRNLPLLTND